MTDGFVRDVRGIRNMKFPVFQGGIAPLLWDGQTKQLSWIVKTEPLDAERDPVKEALTYELRLRQLGSLSGYRVERAHTSKVSPRRM